jgi:hypothetical protein
VRRRDASSSAVGDQPPVWTFLEMQAPDDRADELARALATAILAEGWYASSRSVTTA